MSTTSKERPDAILPPGEWWMFYDHQTGRWCVYDDGPPQVVRTGAEVFHVREVRPLDAAEKAEPVAVKPLEWLDHTKGPGCPIRRIAQPFPGLTVWIFQSGHADHWYLSYNTGLNGKLLVVGDEVAAKAAAQADYEARIRSVLTRPPATREGWKPLTENVVGPVLVCRFGDEEHNWLPLTAYRATGGKWERPASRDGLPYEPTHWQHLPTAAPEAK